MLRSFVGGAFVCAASCAWAQGAEMNSSSERAPFEPPRLVVQAERSYLVGLPILVAVTFANDSPDTEHYRLPELDVLYDHGPLGVLLIGASGSRYEAKPAALREGRMGMVLMPGERKAMLVDLTNFGFPLEADSYTVTFTLAAGSYRRASEPVQIALRSPSAADEAEARRLRRLGRSTVDAGAWAPFLTSNWNTVRPSPALSPDARAQLALHLVLHHALYGPRPIAALDLERLRQIKQPSLAAEVAALAFEIRAPQLDQRERAALFDRVAAGLPAIRFRLDRVLEGEGWLTTRRRIFGADAELSRPSSPPYRDLE
jgi:hypothetical protein